MPPHAMNGRSEADKPESPWRKLAVRVTLLAVTVGAVVAGAAAVSGAGSCAPTAGTVSGGTADVVCYHLVRTLAERVGIATALVTAILALTVVGLSRLPAQQDGLAASDRPR
jgi:hypothetical protein